MTVYFAYGSNMERAAMRKRCSGAQPLGPALLRGWRYVIAAGYGTIVPASGMCVFGVLWKLTPRDLGTLNSYENLDSGLYRRITLTVEIGGVRVRALVFMGRKRGSARPRPESSHEHRTPCHCSRARSGRGLSHVDRRLGRAIGAGRLGAQPA